MRWLLLLAVVFGTSAMLANVSLAGDDNDPRRYARDQERLLRDLERREYNRQRQHADRLDDGISHREHERLDRRLDRERIEDQRRLEDFYRDRGPGPVRHEAYYPEPYAPRYDYRENYYPAAPRTGGGFGFQGRNFSIQID